MQRVTDEEIKKAVAEMGSQSAAARKLGIHRRTLERRLQRLRLRGYAPQHGYTHVVPEGFGLKGVSALYDAQGNLKQQWVKSVRDEEAVQRMLEAALQGFKDEIPRAKPVKPERTTRDSDLLNCYVLTDYHLGMLAQAEDGSPTWSTDMAADMVVRWFKVAIDRAPAAETAVLAQLGDFLHFDGLEPVTPTSKHVLDADTNFQNLVRVAIRVVRQIVNMLLAKYERVHLIIAEGNHDLASSAMMREWMAAFYENEPRITVDTSSDPYYCYEHGLTSLFFHHGHKRRMSDIDATFAAKFRDVFGRTKFSYAHMGHLHHIEVKETGLMVVEQHRTLAEADAYAKRGGWLSGRDAVVVTYSKRHGEVCRSRVSPQMLGLH